MPTVLIDTPPQPATLEPPRKRWTRAECASLEAARLLGLLDQQHLELIEGELISKMGKKRPHVIALTSMLVWLQKVFGEQFVHPEAPIDVAPEDNPTNEPEPDLIVLNREFSSFNVNPRPKDLRLVVEIADTTLWFDLTVKAALYARAGVVEYWVQDVPGRRLIVHRDPQLGKYATIMVYSEHESVAPLSAPQAEFRVTQAFADNSF